MAYFTNTSPGARGVNLKDGTTQWIEPGQSAEIADKDVSDAHEDLAVSDKAPKPDAKAAKADAAE